MRLESEISHTMFITTGARHERISKNTDHLSAWQPGSDDFSALPVASIRQAGSAVPWHSCSRSRPRGAGISELSSNLARSANVHTAPLPCCELGDPADCTRAWISATSDWIRAKRKLSRVASFGVIRFLRNVELAQNPDQTRPAAHWLTASTCCAAQAQSAARPTAHHRPEDLGRSSCRGIEWTALLIETLLRKGSPPPSQTALRRSRPAKHRGTSEPSPSSSLAGFGWCSPAQVRPHGREVRPQVFATDFSARDALDVRATFGGNPGLIPPHPVVDVGRRHRTSDLAGQFRCSTNDINCTLQSVC